MVPKFFAEPWRKGSRNRFLSASSVEHFLLA